MRVLNSVERSCVFGVNPMMTVVANALRIGAVL